MFLINGQSNDTLDVNDRGLHYGDGLFETIAIHKQKPLCWQRHIVRLQAGCERLKIPWPQENILHNEAERICGDTERGILKIILTRGVGGRGYKPPEQIQATRILALYPWPDYPLEYSTQGISVRLCNSRLGRNPQLAGIKHLNRLEQVLARSEWDNPDIVEGLVMDSGDNIIEGTMSNVFALQGDTLLTPDIGQCGIAGIVRQCLLELAHELGFKIIITPLKYQDLQAADAVFVTNSTIGIWPVLELEDHRFSPHPAIGKIRRLLIDRDIIAG